MLRCADCGLEHADPMRTWSALNYPVQEHGFGFDHLAGRARLAGGTGRLLEIGAPAENFLRPRLPRLRARASTSRRQASPPRSSLDVREGVGGAV